MIQEQKNVLARATSADIGVASTGTAEVAVLFVLQDGPNKGAAITWHGYLTELTEERTLESLRHCGWSGDAIGEIRPGNLQGIDSNEVQITIENKTNKDGETYPEVRWVNRLGGGLAIKTSMDDAARKALTARLKGAAIASRTGAPANGKTAPKKPALGPDGDPGFDPDDLGF